jgi:hypothetical protein
MDIALATGSSINFEIGGKEYKLSPLTFADFGTFENWLRGNRIKEALAALPDEAGENLRVTTIRQLADMPISTAAVMAAMSDSFSGIGYVVYLSLKHNHPEMTYEDVCSLVTMENVYDIQAIMLAQSGNESDQEETADQGGPKANPTATGE